MFELDHMFICCSPGAEREAQCLKAAGISEGPSNTHPGQGTACRRFFFANAYLELLWVVDSREASSHQTRPTRLLERWLRRASDASPFGVAFRPKAAASPSAFPLRTWAYTPGYLPSGLSIDFEVDSPLDEPAVFHLGFAARRSYDADSMSHERRVEQITSLVITSPAAAPRAPAGRFLEKAGLLASEPGDSHLARVGFDAQASGCEIDLRPALPLLLCS